MKKVLLLSLSLVLGFSAFAQKKANFNKEAKNFSVNVARPSQERISDGTAAQAMIFAKPTTVMAASQTRDEYYEEYSTMTTNYDLQTNSALGNRIAVWPDGTASFVATWDHSGSTSYPDRGTGYNFYDGSDVGEEPAARQEELKTGWPSITACGEGEILASHGGDPTSTRIYKRATKGSGEWTLKGVLTGVQWPRIAVSGDNDQYVHIFGASQENSVNHLFYARSIDGGETWPSTVDEFPTEIIDNTAEGMYLNQIGADDYVMAANGNDVAILFGSYTYELFYIISHDNGATWEKQLVAPWCEHNAHAHNWDSFPEGTGYKLIADDNSHSIAIDNNGVVHVAFAMYRWTQTDVDHYSYYPMYNYGIVYWNSEYVNEQGGHEIPLFGNWSGDTQFEYYNPDYDSVMYSLDIERIDALCTADGGDHLWLYGYPVELNENGDTLQWESDHCLNRPWHYRSNAMATQPGISVDNNGQIAIIYNMMSKAKICEQTNMYYKNAWAAYKKAGEWIDEEINLSDGFIHRNKEVYSTTASPIAYNGQFWTYYSEDPNQGLYLDKSDDYPQSNLAVLTENIIYGVKIVLDPIGVEELNAVNPLTTTRVYPNPATDMMNVEINASQDANATISVYNITGQSIMNMDVNVTTGINTATIRTSDLSSGVYFVTVNANGFSKTTKVVVK